MTVAGRLPVLNSCICCARLERSLPARLGMPPWLTPFVPWQFAQAAARLRPAASGTWAREGETSASASASAAGYGVRIIRSWPASAARRSGFRGGFGDFLFGELERDLAALVHVHGDFPAVRELSEQQLVGERAPDRVLDEARHRPCAHERIESSLGEVLAQRVGEHRFDLLLLQLGLELHQELVDDAQDDIVA